MLSKIMASFLCVAMFLPQAETLGNTAGIYKQSIILQEKAEDKEEIEDKGEIESKKEIKNKEEIEDSINKETEESVPLDGLIKEEGKYYYYKNGKSVKNKLVTIKNAKYYFKKDGSAAKGVMFIENKFYYFGSNMKYNAAKTKKIRNAAKYEKPFSKLEKFIGKPDKAKYYSSCYGKGRDGVLEYKDFKVYTFKPDKGKEIYMGAE